MREQYQPEWVQGEQISEGVRPCADRYTLIHDWLERYKRPITVLDLGANIGYFSLRITEDHDAIAVAVEHDYTDWLARILEQNENRRVIALHKRITVEWLEALAEVEHFDVVLALSIAHHIGPVDDVMKVCRQLGDWVILEAATEPNACGQPFVEQPPGDFDQRLGTVRTHLGGQRELLVYGDERPKLRTRPYLGCVSHRFSDMSIHVGARRKEAYHRRKNTRTHWHPGINLATYLTEGGYWPTRDVIERWVEDDPWQPHRDIRPWNMILGHGLELIDWADAPDDPRIPDDHESLKLCREAIRYSRSVTEMMGYFNPQEARLLHQEGAFDAI